MDDWPTRYSWIKTADYNNAFSYQALNNSAVNQTNSNVLLFLNNDTGIIHDSWERSLAENATREEIGVVGARLFYPNGLIQQSGVVVGIGGYADHPFSGLHPDTATPYGLSYWQRNVTAVTGSCLAIARSKFEKVDGFDERFIVCGGDVDLCLRLVDHGYRNLYLPFVRLIHHESITRDRQPPDTDFMESKRAHSKYLEQGDPYYNVNPTLEDISTNPLPSK